MPVPYRIANCSIFTLHPVMLRGIIPCAILGCLLGLLGCAPGAQYRPWSDQVAMASETAELCPFPIRFRDIVIEHLSHVYPGDRIQRNIVVRPPVGRMVSVQGDQFAGYVGRVRFHLKDAEQQTYEAVEYCYVLQDNAVRAFEDAREAVWCEP